MAAEMWKTTAKGFEGETIPPDEASVIAFAAIAEGLQSIADSITYLANIIDARD